MKIKPHGKRVYTILDMVRERQVGSIILADKHAEHTRVGTVMAVGERVEDYAPGDRVLVSYYSGVVIDTPELNIKGDGQDVHRMLVEDEILGHLITEG